MAAGAQQVAMRALDQQLLRAQHDVAVVAVEEGQQAAAFVALCVPSRRAEQIAHIGIVELERIQQRRRAEQR